MLVTNFVVNTVTAGPDKSPNWAFYREGVNNTIKGLSAMAAEYVELIKQKKEDNHE